MRVQALVTMAVLASGCAKMFPDKVATGVGRLTVRNAATLVAMIDADTSCGFGSAPVQGQVQVSGETGGQGTATWTVKDCALNFGELHDLATDCSGVVTRAGGSVTVSATRTITGTLTGNSANPVVPRDAEAVSFAIDARFDHFVVRTSDAKTALIMNTGSLKYVASPRLAVSVSQGVCAVPSHDVLLDGLEYAPSTVTIDNEGSLIDVDVDSSQFGAQVGKGVDKENALWGHLSVWTSDQPVPATWDHDGLDPTYDAAAFEKSWSCGADLAQPVSHACPSLDTVVGQGAARLTVLLFGKLADQVDSNTACGFASPAALAGADTIGTLGLRGGHATFDLGAGCQLHFPAGTVVETDCAGVATSFEGTVRVTGTKVVRGIVSGDLAEPIVPTTRDPAELKLRFTFMDFKVSDTAGRALAVASGELSGTLDPTLSKDQVTGACSVKGPVATFSDLAWANATVKVTSAGNTLGVTLDSSNLAAQNGAHDGRANALSGTLTANGKSVPVPADLDPAYDQAAFDHAYACGPRAVVPASDEECSLYPELAINAARLVVQTAGAAASRLNSDKKCGFEALLVKLAPTEVQGKDGDPGLMKWHVKGCDVGAQPADHYATDCSGGKDSISGSVQVTATRTVTGIRQVVLGLIDSITPNTNTSVTIALDQVNLSELAAWHVDPGATAPRGKLTLHRGTLSGTVKPITGERQSKAGSFDVPTPIATFDQLALTGASATLVAGGKTFNFELQSAALEARNGHFQGQGNSLSGSVTIDGHVVALPAGPLDPAYDQASFTASYACTPDLKGPVPAN